MLDILDVAPTSSKHSTMASMAESGNGGTSSQKSIARSKSRYGWSLAKAHPGTRLRICNDSSVNFFLFSFRSDSLGKKGSEVEDVFFFSFVFSSVSACREG